MNIAMMIDLYEAESVLLRVEKLSGLKGAEKCKEQLAIMQVFI